jgi:hypothetical protein
MFETLLAELKEVEQDHGLVERKIILPKAATEAFAIKLHGYS